MQGMGVLPEPYLLDSLWPDRKPGVQFGCAGYYELWRAAAGVSSCRNHFWIPVSSSAGISVYPF